MGRVHVILLLITFSLTQDLTAEIPEDTPKKLVKEDQVVQGETVHEGLEHVGNHSNADIEGKQKDAMEDERDLGHEDKESGDEHNFEALRKGNVHGHGGYHDQLDNLKDDQTHSSNKLVDESHMKHRNERNHSHKNSMDGSIHSTMNLNNERKDILKNLENDGKHGVEDGAKQSRGDKDEGSNRGHHRFSVSEKTLESAPHHHEDHDHHRGHHDHHHDHHGKEQEETPSIFNTGFLRSVQKENDNATLKQQEIKLNRHAFVSGLLEDGRSYLFQDTDLTGIPSPRCMAPLKESCTTKLVHAHDPKNNFVMNECCCSHHQGNRILGCAFFAVEKK